MKKVTDYIFYDSWVLKELAMESGAEYIVLQDLCDLRKGQVVKFIGFDDVDNHFGRFVFTNQDGAVLEVDGDFSSSEHSRFKELKNALSKA